MAKFDIDVTPSVGFAMAYDRVRRVDELTLRARGIVLLGAGEPIALCAVDWIGIANGAHDAFRDAIADAAGTTRERVAVHTLHQHDAPRCDFTAEQLLNEAGVADLGGLEGSFAREVLERLHVAVAEAVSRPQPVTHAGYGEAEVERVASNRRIQDESGNVIATRYTTCRDPKLRALPEGIIDPMVSAVSFWNEETPLAVLSYYACHPQSYYRTGVPSPDFPGIARFVRGQDMPETLHVHFNGAGGNIGAGKFNDGSKSNRMALARRMADGMRRAFEASKKFELTQQDLGWYTAPVALPLGQHLDVEELRSRVSDWKTADYWGGPEQLAWALRCKSGHRIDLGCLKIGTTRVLHMPGELFVEYQLAAKALRPKLNVAMAAYGDYGPGYIGTDESYGQGGYETSQRASKVARGVEKVLMEGVEKLLREADEDLGNFEGELPRIPATEPEDSLSKFEIAEGFEMQLVASEPLIGTPVAMEWDARGRLFVCEMKGYSEDRGEAISSIALLTDSDRDGVYDERTEFASGLLWPTALFPFDGGLFVGDAPHIYYMKDTNHDGVADQKQIVLTGFGVSNVQGLLNSMRWDLDNRIHLAVSSAGGKVHRPEESAAPVSIRGRDFAFDPRTFAFELTSGGAQHGMSFDDWGHKFASSNSNHLMQVLYEERHAARNPYAIPPSSKASIADDGPQAEVYRISPIESWRVVRTRLRVAGLVGGPIEGGGRPAGYFTGATGATIYRGDAWPDENRGVAIVGDVGSNLVHRKQIHRDGFPYTATRIDKNSEWIRSTDNWFRPSQFACGPDGCLYVVDTYREVIEHPKSLPPVIKKHLDLTAGRNRGRIYRISATGEPVRKITDLASLESDGLVALLEHDNAWHRETAARLIFERQDSSCIAGLRKLCRESRSPLGRMHAMYALDGLGAFEIDQPNESDLRDGLLVDALSDEHPQVRRHAVRLIDLHGYAADFQDQLLELASDRSHEVRLQIAYAMSGIKDSEERSRAFVEILQQHEYDSLTCFAAQSSLSGSALGVWRTLLASRDWNDSMLKFVDRLSAQIADAGEIGEIRAAIEVLCELPIEKAVRLGATLGRFAAVDAELFSEQEPVATMLTARMNLVVARSLKRVKDPLVSIAARTEALQNLRYASMTQQCDVSRELLMSVAPVELQRGVFSLLRTQHDPSAAKVVLDTWQQLTPSMRPIAADFLCSRNDYAEMVLDAIESQNLSVDVHLKNQLIAVCKPGSHARKRLDLILGSLTGSSRLEILEDYLVALDLPADETRGRVVFEKNCSSCHRLGQEGLGEIGPNLAAMKNRGPQSILLNILDPNREVGPEFENYLLRTHDDEVITGMIRSESANAVELIRAANDSTIVSRSDIAELRSSGKSIMPEGMEDAISKQEMADLLAFINKGAS
ncbi:MAG: PVC-type heme-binding CxxCH protein [Aureliella sp.]